MNSPFKPLIDIVNKTDVRIAAMRHSVRAVDVGINIQTILDGKKLTALMKEHDWSFPDNTQILAFNRKDKPFNIVDNEGNTINLYPTSVGYSWETVWSPEGRKSKINELASLKY